MRRHRPGHQADPASHGPPGQARIVAAHGRSFFLRLDDGRDGLAVTRGRRSDYSVGDRVTVQKVAVDQWVIEDLAERRNEMRRSDQWRSKRLASNLDQIGMVLAGSPPFSEELLVRVLIAAGTEQINAALIANKTDLAEAQAGIEDRLRCYEALGYPVFRISARCAAGAALEELGPWLDHASTLLLGQSGMGKSSLINLLVPDADLATQAISEALQTGRHTTTFCRMFDWRGADRAGLIIDSPGFQTFGLAHLSISELTHGMREYVPLLGQCRFHNCRHLDEPGCRIRAEVEAGHCDTRRYEIFRRLVLEHARTEQHEQTGGR